LEKSYCRKKEEPSHRKRTSRAETSERTYGDTLIGYSGRTALRRELCDMMPESWDSEVRANVHCQPMASPSMFSSQQIIYMDFHGYEPISTFP
jgi:hypothetical protein